MGGGLTLIMHLNYERWGDSLKTNIPREQTIKSKLFSFFTQKKQERDLALKVYLVFWGRHDAGIGPDLVLEFIIVFALNLVLFVTFVCVITLLSLVNRGLVIDLIPFVNLMLGTITQGVDQGLKQLLNFNVGPKDIYIVYIWLLHIQYGHVGRCLIMK